MVSLNKIALCFFIFEILNLKLKAQEYVDCYQYKDNFILSWSFFEGKVDTNEEFTAASSIEIGYDLNSLDSVTIIQTGAYFFPEQSWVRDYSNKGLEHEFYHFKIAEISRRMMMKELYEYDWNKFPLDMDWWIENRINNYRLHNRNRQSEYDIETNHGLNWLVQKRYENHIDQTLSDLKAYRYEYLIFYFGKEDSLESKILTDRLPKKYKQVKTQ